jgi:thiazole/oxazole-forming peptide maturase SagD family component
MLIFQSHGLFSTIKRSRILNFGDLIEEFKSPKSRFKCPISLKQTVQLHFIKCLLHVVPNLKTLPIVAPALSFYWVRIITFLCEHGMLSSREVDFGPVDHRFPKNFLIRMKMLPSSKNKVNRFPVVAFGCAEDFDIAMSKSIGELLERYFLGYRVSDEIIIGTERKISKKGIILRPSELQFVSFIHKISEIDFSYVKGIRHYGSGYKSDAFIPSQAVFYRDQHHLDKACLMQLTTSGCAGGFSLYDAYLRGLLEIIERDSFLVYWLHGLRPNQISIESVPSCYVKKICAALAWYNIECYFLDLRTDIAVPSVSCVLIDNNNNHTLALGAGAGLDPLDCIEKALSEAVNVLSHAASDHFDLPENYTPFSDYRIGRHQRLIMWKGDLVKEKFKFFIDGLSKSFTETYGDYFNSDTYLAHQKPNSQSSFYHLVKLLESNDHKVYSFSPNNKVLTELGYWVTRVIVPGLIPLYLNEAVAPLLHPRIKTCPLPGKCDQSFINPFPHPFP